MLQEAKRAKAFAPQNRKQCLLVTIDVKNAFNSAPWEGIVKALKKNISPYLIRMITSYFTKRELHICQNNTMDISCGVPQGSVLGPLLWSIYYDEVLRLEMPPNVLLVGYADDLAIVVTADSEAVIVTTANTAIHRIVECMRNLKLKIAPEKTEAVILSNKRVMRQISINVLETKIFTKPEIKYLGVFIDQGAFMKKHIINTCVKAEKSAQALSWLMPNLNGPLSVKRQMVSKNCGNTFNYVIRSINIV